MSAASALPVSDSPLTGGALPGGRLLGLAQRMLRTGRAMARCINRIARQRLEGHDLSRLAPAGFRPNWTNALIVEAVAWTSALRERLLGLAGRPLIPLAPGLPKAARAQRGRGTASFLPDGTPEATADDWMIDWHDLAKPWRMGPSGVAVAMRMIAGKSDQQVVADICDNLRRAAVQLGAEADVARIAALEAAARALLAEAEAAVDAPEDAVAESGGAERASGARAAGPPADEPAFAVEDGPPRGPPPDE